MIDLTQPDALEKLADLVADRVVERINSEQQSVLVSREELARITGLGVRTIDRMAAGGSREKDASGKEIWRESLIKLKPIRNGRKVMFDKAAALSAIKAGNGCRGTLPSILDGRLVAERQFLD